MTSIIETITQKINEARLNQEKTKLENLIYLRSEIKLGLSQKSPVKPQKTIERLLVSFKETQALIHDSNAIQEWQEKIDLVESFLETGETQLDTNALQQLLLQQKPLSIKDWMLFLKTNYEGQYDGKLASTLFNTQK